VEGEREDKERKEKRMTARMDSMELGRKGDDGEKRERVFEGRESERKNIQFIRFSSTVGLLAPGKSPNP